MHYTIQCCKLDSYCILTGHRHDGNDVRQVASKDTPTADIMPFGKVYQSEGGSKHHILLMPKRDEPSAVPVFFDQGGFPMEKITGVAMAHVEHRYEWTNYRTGQTSFKTVTKEFVFVKGEKFPRVAEFHWKDRWAIFDPLAANGRGGVIATAENHEDILPFGRIHGLEPLPIMRFADVKDLRDYMAYQ